MKNYIIAATILCICLSWVNCHRPSANHFNRQYVEIPSILKQRVVLEDSFYVGDTIELVYYTSGLNSLDSIIPENKSPQFITFLGYKKGKQAKEPAFIRGAAPKIENDLCHVFIYKAKRAGAATVGISRLVKGEEESSLADKEFIQDWTMQIRKRK